jgi:hypothetical protein
MANTYTQPHRLDDGTLIYPRRGWEPPPPIEGYRRKSNNPRSADAWIFVPCWSDCKFRRSEQVKKEGCRCVTFFHTCTNDLVGVGRVVTTSICAHCKVSVLNA